MANCTRCHAPAVTEVDGEPHCQGCFNDWWHDNSFNCECGKRVLFADGIEGDNKEYFCTPECQSEHIQAGRDYRQMIEDETRFYRAGAL